MAYLVPKDNERLPVVTSLVKRIASAIPLVKKAANCYYMQKVTMLLFPKIHNNIVFIYFAPLSENPNIKIFLTFSELESL